MTGLIHLYHGEGKGKTTSAMGLALRAVTNGKKVVIVQFLKNGKSSEVKALEEKFGIIIYAENVTGKFSWDMNEKELAQTLDLHNKNFKEAISQQADLLILDEICSACTTNLIDTNMLEKFLSNKPEKLEVVMTGRNPMNFMLEKADYITEMKKIKHPYDQGIEARKGIEY